MNIQCTNCKAEFPLESVLKRKELEYRIFRDRIAFKCITCGCEIETDIKSVINEIKEILDISGDMEEPVLDEYVLRNISFYLAGVNAGLDDYDIDRWILLEKFSGIKISVGKFKEIESKLDEHDIEIFDLDGGYKKDEKFLEQLKNTVISSVNSSKEFYVPEYCIMEQCGSLKGEMPNMRKKVAEYIKEIKAEEDRLMDLLIPSNCRHMKKIEKAKIEARIMTIGEIKNDLMNRMEERI